MKRYGQIIKEFYMRFHLYHHKGQGKYNKKIACLVDKISYYFTYYLMAMMVCGMLMFNILPIYYSSKEGAFTTMNHENMTLEFVAYYRFPGFDCTEHFFIFTTINVYLTYICSANICCLDLLLSMMIFQIIGHIMILKYNIENLPKPRQMKNMQVTNMFNHKIPISLAIFDEEENKEIRRQLIEIMNYHKVIVSFSGEISEFFGPMLAINYLYHLVSGCLLLLVCTRSDLGALVRYGPLTVIIFGQLIQISVIFEVVGYMSEKLIDSVYCTQWESMNLDNQRTVQLILSRVQTPIQVTALGIVPVGVNTMQSVLKTTMTYYTLLRSLNE